METLKKLMAILAISSSVLLLTPTKADARSAFHGLVMTPGFYKRLSQCEVGRNKDGTYKWEYQSKTYTSGFGIARGTWAKWSNSTSAENKSPRYQAEIVDNIAWNGHTGPDGYIYPVGPFGWGTIRENCMGLRDMICQSNNPKVKKWKRNCK